MSMRKHCDRCGEEISDHEVHLTLTVGLGQGAYSLDGEDLEICSGCCRREPVLEGYFRAMHTTEFLRCLFRGRPQANPDTAAGSALGNASVLPQ